MDLPLPRIVAVANDLMFASRMRAAAQQAGSNLVLARSMETLREAAPGARRVLLDLETRWLDAPAAIAELKELEAPPEIVAFASHVLGDVLVSARDAGADRVLARSAFVRDLPDLMK